LVSSFGDDCRWTARIKRAADVAGLAAGGDQQSIQPLAQFGIALWRQKDPVPFIGKASH
jgi:hypothetical protein